MFDHPEPEPEPPEVLGEADQGVKLGKWSHPDLRSRRGLRMLSVDQFEQYRDEIFENLRRGLIRED